MAKWVRLLSRPAGASSQWHVLAIDNEFAVANALCGERLPSAVEVAPDEDRTERDGRCPPARPVWRRSSRKRSQASLTGLLRRSAASADRSGTRRPGTNVR